MTLVGNRWKVACGSSVLLLNWLECSVFKLQWAKEERKFWIKINSKINNRNIFVIRLTFNIQQCMIELLSSNSFRGNFWFWFPTAGLDRLHLKAPYDYIIFEHTTFFAPKCVKISNCLRLIAANYSLSCWQLNQLTCFGVTKISDGLLAKGSNESGLTSPTHLISWCLGFFYSFVPWRTVGYLFFAFGEKSVRISPLKPHLWNMIGNARSQDLSSVQLLFVFWHCKD